MRLAGMILSAVLFLLGCDDGRRGGDAGPQRLNCGSYDEGSGTERCDGTYGACDDGREVHDYRYECEPSSDGGAGATQCTCFVDLVPQATFERDRICELSETVRQSQLRAGCPGWPTF